jgi:hypothetical protein
MKYIALLYGEPGAGPAYRDALALEPADAVRRHITGQIAALEGAAPAPTIAPKMGYLSLRRRKQFAMVQPSTTSRIDLGLILAATTPAAGRLESAAKFNPLFTHRVRITAATDLDDELRGWLATAYALAG